jgi:hypothetical protein
MGTLFSDMLQFAEGLLDHWVAFATGSAPVMLIGLPSATNRSSQHGRNTIILPSFAPAERRGHGIAASPAGALRTRAKPLRFLQADSSGASFRLIRQVRTSHQKRLAK